MIFIYLLIDVNRVEDDLKSCFAGFGGFWGSDYDGRAFVPTEKKGKMEGLMPRVFLLAKHVPYKSCHIFVFSLDCYIPAASLVNFCYL